MVLTKDRHICYRTTEREALMRAGVAAFVLTAGNLTGDERARIFVKAVPAIKRFLARQEPPLIAKLSRSGRIILLIAAKPRGRGRR